MEEKLSGIVLSGVNYAESDKILSIFTLEKGVISAKIKGVKKAKAKLKFASEPFCFAEFLFSTNADKRVVTGASLIDSFYAIREDVDRYYCGATVLEFVKKFGKESLISADMFLLTIETLKSLSYSNNNCLTTLSQFLIKALMIVGYGLDLNGCHKCGEKLEGRIYFDYDTGGFYSSECAEDYFREINLDTYKALNLAFDGLESPCPEKGLRLLEYYVKNKIDVEICSLNQLNKINS